MYLHCINILTKSTIKHGRNRMKGYIRMGVYAKIEKEQHWRITKKRFTPLSREEMDIFRTESKNMQLIKVGETIEKLVMEEVSPTSKVLENGQVTYGISIHDKKG